jgi:hypothetical protein
MTVVWVIASYSLVETVRRFRVVYCLHQIGIFSFMFIMFRCTVNVLLTFDTTFTSFIPKSDACYITELKYGVMDIFLLFLLNLFSYYRINKKL